MLWFLVLPWLAGCSTLQYYAQAVHGHFTLLYNSRPTDELLTGDALPPAQRGKLRLLAEIREFASRRLGLPDNRSYRSVALSPGDFVVWAVVATPEFSLQPRTWCFPVVGCTSYRGYYHEADAREFADGLRAEGLDVLVSGVAAYSTLGWFDDPLPQPILDWPDYAIAGLVFHELAHQVVYVADDSAFNEAFAVAVARTGTRRWLNTPERAARLPEFDAAARGEDAVLGLLSAARADLERLYAEDFDAASMRRRKADILAGLRARYRALAGAGHGAYFDTWFSGELNNARLALVSTYYRLVPGFTALLDRAGGDLPAFYAEVRALAAQPPAQRAAILRRAGAGSGAVTDPENDAQTERTQRE
jgi:predicted aminopeptidase